MKKIWMVCLIFFLSACSATQILLPYHEEPLCRKGYGTGYCGGISEVYDRIDKDLANKKTSRREN